MASSYTLPHFPLILINTHIRDLPYRYPKGSAACIAANAFRIIAPAWQIDEDRDMNSNVDDSVTARRLGTAIIMMCIGAMGLVAAAITVAKLFG